MASAPDIAEALDRCRHLIRRLRAAGVKVPVESIRGDIEDLDRRLRRLQGFDPDRLPRWNDLFVTEKIWGGLGGTRNFLAGIGTALDRLTLAREFLEQMQSDPVVGPVPVTAPASVDAQVQDATAPLRELKDLIHREKRLLEALESQRSRAEQEHQELQSRIQIEQGRLSGFRQQAEDAEATLEGLQEKIRREKRVLEELESLRSRAEQEHQELQSWIQVEQGRLSGFRQQAEETESAARDQRLRLEQEVQQQCDALVCLQENLETLRQEQADELKRTVRLTGEVAALQQQRDGLHREIEELEARLRTLQLQGAGSGSVESDLRSSADTDSTPDLPHSDPTADAAPAGGDAAAFPADRSGTALYCPVPGEAQAASVTETLPEYADHAQCLTELEDSLERLRADLQAAEAGLNDLQARQDRSSPIRQQLMADFLALEDRLPPPGIWREVSRLQPKLRNFRYRMQESDRLFMELSEPTDSYFSRVESLREDVAREGDLLLHTAVQIRGGWSVEDTLQLAEGLEDLRAAQSDLRKRLNDIRVGLHDRERLLENCLQKLQELQAVLTDLQQEAVVLSGAEPVSPPSPVPPVVDMTGETQPVKAGDEPRTWQQHREDAEELLDQLMPGSGSPGVLPYSVVLIRHIGSAAEVLTLLRAGIRVFLCSSTSVPELDEWAREWGATRLLDCSEAPPDVSGQTLCGTGEEVIQVLQHLAAAKVSRPFNLEQYRIEHAPSEQDLMVTAGAGTGKTTVMIQRIFHLMHQQPDLLPAGVAMVTFTREASRVMRERLRTTLIRRLQLTGNPRYRDWLLRLRDLHVSTFHAFGRRLLTELAPLMGLSGSISVSSSSVERRELLVSALDEVCRETSEEGRPQLPDALRSRQDLPIYEVIDLLKRTWDELENRGVSLEQMPDAVDWGLEDLASGSARVGQVFRDTILHAAQEARARNNRAGCMTISDLNLRLASVDEQLFAAAGSRLPTWRFLFIDEFQDTDDAQIQLSVLLRRRFGVPLFVVGDIKQSIYRFRGADYTAFTRLEKDLGEIDFEHYSLSLNYRTAAPILEKLNPLFRKWASHRYLQFEPTRDMMRSAVPVSASDTPMLKVLQLRDKSSLSRFLRDVWKSRSEGETVALLTRTNRQCRQVSELLREMAVPHRISGRGQLLQHPAAIDLGILIRALTLQGDRQAIADLLMSSWNPRPIGWVELVGSSFPSPVDCLGPDWEHLQRISVRRTALAVLAEAVRLLRPARQYVRGLQRQRVPREEILDRGRTYQAAMDRLLSLILDRMGDASLRQIGQWLAIQRIADDRHDVPESTERSSLLQCMTIHQAKGDEFDTVLLPLTDYGFLSQLKRQEVLVTSEPNAGWRVGWSIGGLSARHREVLQQSEQEEAIREESRLLYVALTRARRCLMVGLSGTAPDNPPSTQAALLRLGGLVG